MQPSSIDLAGLTPDPSTLLAAIGAVGLVLLGVQLAVKGYNIVGDMLAERRGWYVDDIGETWYRDDEGRWRC